MRGELARKDALMLNMSETMRQLMALKDEGSPEARDSRETATGPIGRGKRLHRRGEATGTRTAARILGSPVRDARRVTGVVIILTWWGTVTASWNPIKGRVLAWVGEVDQTDLNGATPRNLVAVVGVLVARDAAVANAKNAGTSA